MSIDIIEKGVNLEESDIVTLTSSLQQLERKRSSLAELDTIIAAEIETPGELEVKVIETEEIQEILFEKVTLVKKLRTATCQEYTYHATLPVECACFTL